MDVAVIGAGAAGCFGAIEIARRHPEATVTILEASAKPMAKLAVTGGGRCNLTNSFLDVESLEAVYPRGHRLMKRALNTFSNRDTIQWFNREGVKLVTQEDQCVFPASQDAMQVVRTLYGLMEKHGVRVLCNQKVVSITPGPQFLIKTESSSFFADKLLVTTGGSPKDAGLGFLEPLQLETIHPVPSLFTMRVDDASLKSLSGTLANVRLGLAGTKFRTEGTLLLTDWGISGPAALKLSSYAARYLAENSYRATLLVNWQASLPDFSATPGKLLSSVNPQGITSRLWLHLIRRSGIREDIRCAELGAKGASRLKAVLDADTYQLSGRVHFKEEFVTCGGVSLKEINPSTMESKKFPGLFFAGEVLDIDAVTGGFNLQAAWSTAWCAANSF